MSETPKRRIKIVGSGLNPVKWHVLDADTGEPMRFVRRVEVIADAQTGVCEALLYVHGPDVDIEIDATFTTEERTKEQRIVDAVIAGVKRLIQGRTRS